MDVVVALGGGSSTRHSCKVCRKGFPCGRSLGGHMRSHSLAEVAAVDDDDDDATSDADADDDDEPGGARGSNGVAAASGGGGYGLRENPKKTRRFSGLDGGGDAHGEGECRGDRGEPFPSCRPALRRHAPEEVGGYAGGEDDVGVEVVAKWEKDEEEDEDMAMVPSEAAVLMPAPRRRRRSMRVPAPAPPPPPAAARDAFDGEPEDVALCLIMLSRDTPPGRCMHADYSPETNRRRRDGGVARNGYHHHHHHHADSDDGASALFHYADVEITRSGKTRKPAGPIAGAGEEKRGRYECPGCGRVFQSYQALGGHRASHKRINSSCSVTKVVAPPDQPEPSAKITSSFSTASALASPDVGGAADTVVLAVKAKKVSSKFECPICFKVFGSGQALGGHKRSHSIAGELYERAHADNDAGIVEPEQSVMAVRFLDLNLPAPGAEE